MKTMISILILVLLQCIVITPLCVASSPALNILTTEHVGTSQATLVLLSSGTGTGYFTLLNGGGANCGVGTQIMQGIDSTGATAPYHGSLPLTADLLGRYMVRNLTHNTAYTICFTADSPTGQNLQDTPSSADLTTAATTDIINPVWGAMGSEGFSSGAAYYTTLAFSPDGIPYVAYQDGGTNRKASVKRYHNSTWSVVGSAGFSSGSVAYTSMAFAPDGTPYVAYADMSNNYKATVMKYSGDTWSAVGSGASSGGVSYLSLAFAPDGSPCVAYLDGSKNRKATVMKYSSGAWSVLGSAGFSSDTANSTSLAFASDGTPYVAYQDWGAGNKATVMVYRDGAWRVVGSAGFSAGAATNTSLAIAPDGTPYVVYQDGSVNTRLTLMNYSNGSWRVVGTAGFSVGAGDSPAIAFSGDGAPYVAFQDGANSSKATVMKYRDSAWSVVGQTGFSSGSIYYPSLAFGADGSPYVAYQEGSPSYRATVMKLKNGSTVTVSTDRNPATVGQSITFTASVSPSAATGTITFKDGATTLWTGYPSGGTAAFSTSALYAGSHSITAVYSGDDNHKGSTSSVLTQTVLTSVTVTTAPVGRSFAVDGVTYSSAQSFNWVQGGRHTIAVASPQAGSVGTNYIFSLWSDGGAMSHTITAPGTAGAYTANFSTQYQLTTAVNPVGTGLVSPVSGAWYSSGSVVPVKAFLNAGYSFVSWSGSVANSGVADTTVTMTGPQSITANLAGSPLLSAAIAGKSGTANARIWNITVSNTGQSTASASRISGLTLTQTFGAACNPVVSPTQFPVLLGNIVVGGSVTGPVTIDFSGCVATARFTATISTNANNGAVTGSTSYGNQFR